MVTTIVEPQPGPFRQLFTVWSGPSRGSVLDSLFMKCFVDRFLQDWPPWKVASQTGRGNCPFTGLPSGLSAIVLVRMSTQCLLKCLLKLSPEFHQDHSSESLECVLSECSATGLWRISFTRHSDSVFSYWCPSRLSHHHFCCHCALFTCEEAHWPP